MRRCSTALLCMATVPVVSALGCGCCAQPWEGLLWAAQCAQVGDRHWAATAVARGPPVSSRTASSAPQWAGPHDVATCVCVFVVGFAYGAGPDDDGQFDLH
jgi:hypothetical protein